MFYYQSSTLGPNPLHASAEQEEHHYKGRGRLLREVGNCPSGRSKKDAPAGKRTWNGISGQREGENELQEQVQRMGRGKKTNVIMQFDSDDDADQLHPQQETQIQPSLQQTPPLQPEGKEQQAEESTFQVPKKNNFLLDFSDDQNSQEEPSQENVEAVAVSEEKPTILSKPKNNLILSFDSEEEEEEIPSNHPQFQSYSPAKNVLNSLLARSNDIYHLEPIDHSQVLQCVIKRQRNSSGIKYQIHDSATLRNIMTVIKSQDGYLLISKYQQLAKSAPAGKGETVVGKLLSNFFGTEFNCYLWTYPFKKFTEYTVDPDKSKQVITIEYQTNIFGLKGPRKMTAFIPTAPIISKKRLNEIYEHEKKKQLAPSVYKFKNKTPKWNSSIDAYVLNFNGRATVSSIKNFIMVEENDEEHADPKILFGKFGKDLFNLDVRYPFNLMQGVALALSSFDKKLACE